MKKVEAHKKYYDKSYFYDSIHTEAINITLSKQKIYIWVRKTFIIPILK